MARPKNRNQVKKLHPTVSVQTVGYIEQLIQIGSYGNSEAEVAAYLIQRTIDDLLRTGLIKLAASNPSTDG